MTSVIERTVTDRVFLLGLDKLYRDAMKANERGELLACARAVADALGVTAGNAPVEGYYGEHPDLTEYFQLVRSLQAESDERRAEVASLESFRRLEAVTSAPLYGRPHPSPSLFPAPRDALAHALARSPGWDVASIVAAAEEEAIERDDFSLVGLASRSGDAIVIAACRESTVLYADHEIALSIPPDEPEYVYVWEVTPDLAAQAQRFIDAYHELFPRALPPATEASADRYWHACADNEITDRCVRIGFNPDVDPVEYYHWAIEWSRGDGYRVDDFWRPEVVTTAQYREEREARGV